MADADDRETTAPAACSPCRGTGRVLSHLGGTASEVVCPWCEGGGVQLPGHDAQAARRAGATAA
jgi:DnaJ-class molecular chaperone